MTVQISELKNGLRVITDSFEQVQTAALGIWVPVGSRHEQERESGIAHFLEHMAFKGTNTRTAQDISQEIEDVGGYLNAATSRETTAYYSRVLKENVPLALDILGDILFNSIFAEEEIEKEREVILQEISQSNDTPDDIIFDYFQSTAYKDQPMGRPILGTVDIVSGITRKSLQEFMASKYQPSKMVVAAAGNVIHKEIVSQAQDLFGSLPAANDNTEQTATYTGGKFHQHRDLEQVHLLLGYDGLAITDPDYYSASVLASILGGGMSSRLFQEVREKRGLAYSVYAFKSSYSDSGIMGIYAGTGPGYVQELLPVVQGEVGKIMYNIEDEELERSKAQLKAGLMMGLESTSARCERLANQLLFYDRHISLEEIMEKIEAVTTDDLYLIAQKLFTTNSTLASIGPIAA